MVWEERGGSTNEWGGGSGLDGASLGVHDGTGGHLKLAGAVFFNGA